MGRVLTAWTSSIPKWMSSHASVPRMCTPMITPVPRSNTSFRNCVHSSATANKAVSRERAANNNRSMSERLRLVAATAHSLRREYATTQTRSIVCLALLRIDSFLQRCLLSETVISPKPNSASATQSKIRLQSTTDRPTNRPTRVSWWGLVIGDSHLRNRPDPHGKVVLG